MDIWHSSKRLMELLPRLRQQRHWLAFVALALCLPWLATVGSGRCMLRTDLPVASIAVPSQPAADHCFLCCPPTTAPVPRPAGAMFCCEAFRAFLPSCLAISEFKRLELRGASLAGSPFLAFFTAIFSGARPSDARVSFRPSRPIPPGAFLRTVSRRCFPSHAPPLPSALLS